MRFPKPHGPRGYAILAAAVFTFGRANGYLQAGAEPSTPAILLQWPIPIYVWGILWLVTGLYVTVAAFTTHHAVALSALSGAFTLWGVIYVWSAITRLSVVSSWAEVAAPLENASYHIAFAGIIFSLSKLLNPGPKLKRIIDEEVA